MLVLHVRLGCGSLSMTTPVSLLANEFAARSIKHMRVSLAAANQICIIPKTMNGCKNLKIHQTACFENSMALLKIAQAFYHVYRTSFTFGI